MRRFCGVVLFGLAFAACGDDSPTGPSRNAPYNETITGTVSAFGSTRHGLQIPRAGNMTVRLTWNESVDLDLFLANAACSSLYPKAACGIVAQSDSAVGQTETIARTVTAGEQYSLWVDNLNPNRASTYTLTLSIP